LLFGGGYDHAPLMVLSALIPLASANAVTRGFLWSSERQREAARNMAIVLALLIPALWLLVGRYGASGAAGALVAAEGALLALNLGSTGMVSLPWRLWPCAAGASGAVCVGYAAYIFTEGGAPLWAVGPACALAFAAISLAFGGLRRDEMTAIWNSFRT
jgi:O-antigen/teichoic acid export membrane protein